MAEPLIPVDPQRLRHGYGEALLGRDFADQADQDDQLQWWHNRALHGAYGVVHGLDVTLATAGGIRSAHVTPGLAYDCHGRALAVDEPRQVVVPAADVSQHVLVIGFGAGARAGATAANGWCHDEPLTDGPVTLTWLPVTSFTARDGVPLAHDDTAAFSPPRARPLARPRIGRGATVPGQAAWIPWIELLDPDPESLTAPTGLAASMSTGGGSTRRDTYVFLGIQVTIDTSAAGFTATPRYMAEVTTSGWDSSLALAVLLPFVNIAGATKDQFTFRLLMPWMYAKQGEHHVEATSAGAEVGMAKLTVLEQSGTREINVAAQPAARQPDLDYGAYLAATRGLARTSELAVSWMGIQHRGVPKSVSPHVRTRRGSV